MCDLHTLAPCSPEHQVSRQIAHRKCDRTVHFFTRHRFFVPFKFPTSSLASSSSASPSVSVMIPDTTLEILSVFGAGLTSSCRMYWSLYRLTIAIMSSPGSVQFFLYFGSFTPRRQIVMAFVKSMSNPFRNSWIVHLFVFIPCIGWRVTTWSNLSCPK